MRRLYADFNEMVRPGVVHIHARMQPDRQLPPLKEGEVVALVEYGDGEESTAVLHRDTHTGEWQANMSESASVTTAASSYTR